MSDMTITLTLNAENLKKGVDEAEAKLKGVPAEKNTKLTGDSTGLVGAISNVQKQLIGLAAGAFAVTKVWQVVTGTIGQAVDESREATIAQRLLKSQLEATGNAAGISAEGLIQISAELQKISNMGDDAIIKNLTVPLTTFRAISGEVFERTQKAVLDLNAVLGDPNNPESLKSVTIQLGKALNDPIQGLTALRRVGVSFSDSQIATIKNLAETNRLAEAQGLILSELETEFGGAAAATVNSSIQMKNAWGDMLEEFGKKTLPVLDAVNLSFANFWSIMASNMGTYADNQTEVQRQMFRGWNDFTTAFILNARALGAFVIHTGSIVSGSITSMFDLGRGGIVAFAKSVWDVVDKLPKAVMETIGLGSLEGLKDLASGIGDNYKKVGQDVSIYLKTLDAEAQKALSGFTNYLKDFNTITGESQKTYAKQLELQKSLKDTMGGGAEAGASGSGAVAKAQSEYDKLMVAMQGYLRENELARLSAYKRELVQLADKQAEEEAIIQAAQNKKEITKEEAAAKLLELDALYADKSKLVMDKLNADIQVDLNQREQEEIKIKADAIAKKLMDEGTYYETMKFMDGSYYSWKMAQIEKEVNAMAISDAQKVELIRKLKEDMEKELGSDNVSGMGEKTQKSWFFGQVLGFDPNDPADNDKVAAIKSTYSDIVSGAQNMVGQLISLSKQRKDEDILSLEDKAAKEKWSDERLLAEKKKVNAAYAAEEKKLRNIQKGISITQAIINTAEGMTSALRMGPILGPIMAAMIGAMGAVQIGLIAAQKFASGGLFRGKGGPKDDQNIIAVSDGEYIMNAEATRMYLPLLEKLNRIQGFAAGGAVSGGGGGGAGDSIIETSDVMSNYLIVAFNEDFNKRFSELLNSLADKWMVLEEYLAQICIGLGKIKQSSDNNLFTMIGTGIKHLFGFASGGYVSGIGGQQDDANLAFLSNGEYVINADKTAKYKPLLDSINYGRGAGSAIPRLSYADGGEVRFPLFSNSKMDLIIEKLEILNLNLVKKNMNVVVKNDITADKIVRAVDETRERMVTRGYVPAV